MKEIKDIIAAYYKSVQEGRQTALATVVHLEGSSYRRPGARMLITDNGQLTGAISGGCLEGDALRKALLAMAEQKPMLVTYDSMDDDDAKFGVGLGCNGIIQVLIEPIDANEPNNPIQFLEEIVRKRQQAVLVTLFSLQQKKSTQQGTCFLFKEDGTIIEKNNYLQSKDILLADATAAMENKQSVFKNYVTPQKDVTAFIEMIQPALSLIVIGAGNDVIPLTKMADILGWETTVIDGRAAKANKDRFENACKIIVAKPENILSQISIDRQTVFLLMTHNFNYDKAMLKELIQRDIVYIGMLGPIKKLERILHEFKEEGLELNEQQRAVIHSPVGLDIGAETPEEIALSIVAEIKAALAGKKGKPLKEFSTTIHSREATVIEEVRLTSNT